MAAMLSGSTLSPSNAIVSAFSVAAFGGPSELNCTVTPSGVGSGSGSGNSPVVMGALPFGLG